MLISNQSTLLALVSCSTELGDGATVVSDSAVQPGAKQHARKLLAKLACPVSCLLSELKPHRRHSANEEKVSHVSFSTSKIQQREEMSDSYILHKRRQFHCGRGEGKRVRRAFSLFIDPTPFSDRSERSRRVERWRSRFLVRAKHDSIAPVMCVRATRKKQLRRITHISIGIQ